MKGSPVRIGDTAKVISAYTPLINVLLQQSLNINYVCKQFEFLRDLGFYFYNKKQVYSNFVLFTVVDSPHFSVLLRIQQ